MFVQFKGAKTVTVDGGGPGLGSGSDGKTKVRVSKAGRRVKITGLPAKVRYLRLVLDSPTLRVQSVSCTTRTWMAKLWDWKGFTASVKTSADVRCPKGASR
jgi:hypothetical protein